MSGEQAEVGKKKTLFWPLNLLPGLTHMSTTGTGIVIKIFCVSEKLGNEREKNLRKRRKK